MKGWLQGVLVPLQLQIAEDDGLGLPLVARAKIDPELAFGLLGGPDQDQLRPCAVEELRIGFGEPAITELLLQPLGSAGRSSSGSPTPGGDGASGFFTATM